MEEKGKGVNKEQHPTEQKGDCNLWELLYGGKPMGWGKTRVQDMYTKLPSVSDEERAKIEAEKQEKVRLHEESAKLSGI